MSEEEDGLCRFRVPKTERQMGYLSPSPPLKECGEQRTELKEGKLVSQLLTPSLTQSGHQHVRLRPVEELSAAFSRTAPVRNHNARLEISPSIFEFAEGKPRGEARHEKSQ